MKKLELKEMEVQKGGCNPRHQQLIASFIGGAFFGPIGGLLYGSAVYSFQGDGSHCI